MHSTYSFAIELALRVYRPYIRWYRIGAGVT